MESGLCLYWTLTRLGTVPPVGLRALLQARSMSRTIQPRHLDDGLQPMRFSYE